MTRPFGFVLVRVYEGPEEPSSERVLSPLCVLSVERGGVGRGEPDEARPRLLLTVRGQPRKLVTCGVSFEDFCAELALAMRERAEWRS